MNWFSRGYHGERYCLWARTHDGDGDDGGVAQDGDHTPNNRLTETCSLGFPCTLKIYDIMLWSIDTCQIKLSADQYHVTISQAHVYSSSSSCVLLKLTVDQVLVFDWIAGSCQPVNSKRVGNVVPGVVVYLKFHCTFHAWVGWVSEIK